MFSLEITFIRILQCVLLIYMLLNNRDCFNLSYDHIKLLIAVNKKIDMFIYELIPSY